MQGSRGPITDSVHSVSLTCQHSRLPERTQIDIKTPCFPLTLKKTESLGWGLGWETWTLGDLESRMLQVRKIFSAPRHPTDTATPATGPNQACAQRPTSSSGLASANQGVAIFALARCTKQHATAQRYKQGGGGNCSAVLCSPWQSLPWAFEGGGSVQRRPCCAPAAVLLGRRWSAAVGCRNELQAVRQLRAPASAGY